MIVDRQSLLTVTTQLVIKTMQQRGRNSKWWAAQGMSTNSTVNSAHSIYIALTPSQTS